MTLTSASASLGPEDIGKAMVIAMPRRVRRHRGLRWWMFWGVAHETQRMVYSPPLRTTITRIASPTSVVLSRPC